MKRSIVNFVSYFVAVAIFVLLMVITPAVYMAALGPLYVFALVFFVIYFTEENVPKEKLPTWVLRIINLIR